MILCLIRSGMVLTLTEIWKVFVQKRDFSGNIERPMEKTKQNTPAKTKVYISKKAGADGGKIKAKRSSKSSIKMGIKKTKKLMVLEKSDTKGQFSMDDFPSK